MTLVDLWPGCLMSCTASFVFWALSTVHAQRRAQQHVYSWLTQQVDGQRAGAREVSWGCVCGQGQALRAEKKVSSPSFNC